ncbi:MAG TPA: glycerol-3-phosphate 1-O-acyltransferase, partial [Desulfobacteraceae bacterium]|nr:glycerol-3-phosphate 1-O-acyltransferase [Desulfobacteraceae bacterium]
IDISTVGSGNIGATNVAREIGVKWGALTLILDCLKGLAPTAVAVTSYSGHFEPSTMAALSGLAALIGHQFSVFLKFKGGKGVATALGVFIVLCPVCVASALVVFVLLVYIPGYISLASMGASVCMPVFLIFSDAPDINTAAGFLIAGLIVLAHRDNILRLKQKQEPRWRNRTLK